LTLPISNPSHAEWDAFVVAQPRGHVLQLTDWGALKGAFGWGHERLALREGEQIVAGVQLLFRPLPLRLGTMAYLAMGPYASGAALTPNPFSLKERGLEDSQSPSPRTMRSGDQTLGGAEVGFGEGLHLWRAIHALARKHRAVFLKWEPGIFAAGEAQPDPAALGFRPAPQTIQPPRTILIDINGDDDAILARMNQGTRRKIRQSLKNGVIYREATREDVPRFTQMMMTTGARNAFGVHSAAYYERAYELFVPKHAALILAEHDGEALAGVMVFALGRQAWYLYGASSDHKRNLMASYGAQWTAIQWAKVRGSTTYDLWGIPDEDEATLEAGFETRGDSLWGVYGFKRGWGGQIIRSLGAWDYAYNPALYAAYRVALRLRRGLTE
jgi:lipid II:glycine glycyltransferase (peptidoglycan interpeptide bridge formation enzyme)